MAFQDYGTCLECYRVWKQPMGDETQIVKCPHCGSHKTLIATQTSFVPNEGSNPFQIDNWDVRSYPR